MSRPQKIFVVLISAICLFIGSGASAQTSSQFPEGSIKQRPGNWSAFEASWLIGHEVSTPQGGRLGTIESLIIDSSNGRVALFVLSDVPGIGSKRLALPYQSVDRTGQDTFVFNPGRMTIDYSPGESYRGASTDPYIYALTTGAGSSKFYGIPSDITRDWVASIYGYYGQEFYWAGRERMGESVFFNSTRLMGADIRTSGVDPMLHASDLVIDSSDGHIAFVVLSDIGGKDNALVAIPFSAIRPMGENVFVLQIPIGQLASAPRFDMREANTNRGYVENIYIYFGVQPYWTEAGTRVR